MASGPHGEMQGETPRPLRLSDGSRVAVIGGGPAGSLSGYFLLDMAGRVGMDLKLDIFEPRDFTVPGPAGCNMCGGIISESLVQALAAEGINLPPTVVERGIDSYVLHMKEGDVRIETPLEEKRIAAVHRGAGPKGMTEKKWRSFDGYLLELAVGKGARLVNERVADIGWEDGRPRVKARGASPDTYDLLVVAVGINTATLKLVEKLGLGYAPPGTTKTYIAEFHLGQQTVDRHFGTSMHVFLLDLPRLQFAALIPKGDYVTLCLLGRDIDKALVDSFLAAPEVKRCFPPGWRPPVDFCHCSPRINVRGAVQPFADRMVCVGDCGVSRLYKDGIGAAYRTAKAAAVTAVFDGVSSKDFRRKFWPVCKSINADNACGKVIFLVSREQTKRPRDRRGILRMIARERHLEDRRRRMSTVMWDMFTGSAHYRDILLRTMHPLFVGRLVWEVLAGTIVGVPRAQEGMAGPEGSAGAP